MSEIKVKGYIGKIEQSYQYKNGKKINTYYVSFGEFHWKTVGEIAVQLHLTRHKMNEINWDPFLHSNGFNHWKHGRFPEFYSKQELLSFVDFLNGKTQRLPFINMRFFI